jgi:hypothetical protein
VDDQGGELARRNPECPGRQLGKFSDTTGMGGMY